MDELTRLLTEKKASLEKTIAEIKLSLKTAPEGRIQLCYSNGHPQYYAIEDNGKRRYLNKGDLPFLKGVAQRNYDKKLAALLERELRKIKAVLRECPAEDLYRSLPESRKKLVEPRVRIPELYEAKWKSYAEEQSKKIRNDFPKTDPFYLPDGTKVRSKSEAIIAETLSSFGITFFYELPLIIRNTVLFPDFTIPDPQNCRVFYWEHLGLTDKRDYLNEQIRRINLYASQNILPGKNLIFTMESAENPLNTRLVRQLVRSFFVPEPEADAGTS